MKLDTSHRFTLRGRMGLLAAGLAFVFFAAPGTAAAAPESHRGQATAESRSASHHRGDHYHHGRKSHRGHYGKDSYRSHRRSGYHRHHRHHRHYRSGHHYRGDHRGRYSRHHRDHRRYRYHHDHRYLHRDGPRYGHPSRGHHYRPRHFEIPRRILRNLVHTYRDYHYGRHYYPAHNHYHEIYRFPVYYGPEVSYRPYAYCEGAYFATGVFGHDGPRFDVHLRF